MPALASGSTSTRSASMHGLPASADTLPAAIEYAGNCFCSPLANEATLKITSRPATTAIGAAAKVRIRRRPAVVLGA